MGSLPPQPIDGLSAPARKEAYQQLGRLSLALGEGVHEEDELAKRAGFSSAEVMRISLGNWGLSALLPHEAKAPTEDGRTRKAQQSGGEAKELPPITNAAGSFRNTIRTLEIRLEYVSDLKETLQGNRFVSEGHAGENHGPEARGGQWFPNPHETILIAACILDAGGGNVERLLKELHPDPKTANRKQLFRYISGIDLDAKGGAQDKGDGFVHRGRQIAALIRGVPRIRRGTKDPPIPSVDQFFVWQIEAELGAGLSEQEASQKMQKEWKIKQGDYNRLRKLAEGP